jgi:hypothetical protein
VINGEVICKLCTGRGVKGVYIAYFKTLLQNVPGATKEKYERAQSGQPIY